MAGLVSAIYVFTFRSAIASGGLFNVRLYVMRCLSMTLLPDKSAEKAARRFRPRQ